MVTRLVQINYIQTHNILPCLSHYYLGGIRVCDHLPIFPFPLSLQIPILTSTPILIPRCQKVFYLAVILSINISNVNNINYPFPENTPEPTTAIPTPTATSTRRPRLLHLLRGWSSWVMVYTISLMEWL